MFTGIIESLGIVSEIEHNRENIHFDIKSQMSDTLKIDQSVAHDGVCLTVIKVDEGIHRVTAIRETLEKSNLSTWEVGSMVNLERCMPANGRFDGHIVQGHVDTIGVCEEIMEDEGSWRFTISHAPNNSNFTVSKGSITINGVSLTVVNSQPGSFSVAIIPYTYHHTTFNLLKKGNTVNLEFDIIGKYVAEMMRRRAIII